MSGPKLLQQLQQLLARLSALWAVHVSRPFHHWAAHNVHPLLQQRAPWLQQRLHQAQQQAVHAAAFVAATLVPRTTQGVQQLLLLSSIAVILFVFALPNATTPPPYSLEGAGRQGGLGFGAIAPSILERDDTLLGLTTVNGASGMDVAAAADAAATAAALEAIGADAALIAAAAAPTAAVAAGPAAAAAAAAEEQEEEVRKAAVDVDMAERMAAEAEERKRRAAELSRTKTTCSCYRINNPFCCAQVLCSCGAVCWNGRELVAQVKHGASTVACAHQEDRRATRLTVNASAGVIRPMMCTEKVPYGGSALDTVVAEGGLRELGKRDLGWLEEREKRAVWRMGATYLQRLDLRLAAELAAFAARLFPLLLFNNATTGGKFHVGSESGSGTEETVAAGVLWPPLERVMFPRDKFFRALTAEHGADGLRPHLLELLLRVALVEPLKLGSMGVNPPEWHRRRVVLDEERWLQGTSGPIGLEERHVEFDTAWSRATDAAPLCFEELILPGALKGVLFPGLAPQAHVFHDRIREILAPLLPPQLPPAAVGIAAGVDGPPPRLLYVRRADTMDRTLDPDAERQIMGLFHELGFRVSILDIHRHVITPDGSSSSSDVAVAAGTAAAAAAAAAAADRVRSAKAGAGIAGVEMVTLVEMVAAVQAADVIVGVHSSGLQAAAALLRRGTVILELMPHHLLFNDVRYATIAAGGLHLGHMVHRGPVPVRGPSATRWQPRNKTSGAGGRGGVGGDGSAGEEALGGERGVDGGKLEPLLVEFAEQDERFSKQSVAHCMNAVLNYPCRQYFMRDRPITFSTDGADTASLRALLQIARHHAEAVAQRGYAAAAVELARQTLAVCLGGREDMSFCMSDTVSTSAIPKGGLCVIQEECWAENPHKKPKPPPLPPPQAVSAAAAPGGAPAAAASGAVGTVEGKTVSAGPGRRR